MSKYAKANTQKNRTFTGCIMSMWNVRVEYLHFSEIFKMATKDLKKTTFLLFLVLGFSTTIFSQEVNLKTKVNFTAQNLSISDALRQISEENDLSIAFSEQFFSNKWNNPINSGE